MRALPLATLFLVTSVLHGTGMSSAAEPDPKDKSYSIGEGKITFSAPEKWVRKQPKVRIVEHEFGIPAVEGDTEEGRFTVMGAGGAIEDNIARWVGQFGQADGKSTRDFTKVEKKTVAGQEVHFVDITGIYKDSPAGPFGGGKTIERADYRMLAAILVTEKDGNYFLKLYGPKKTIAAQEEAFIKMVTELKKK